MKLIWNGHSCFTPATEAGTLVIDPYEDGSVPGLSPSIWRLTPSIAATSTGTTATGPRWPSAGSPVPWRWKSCHLARRGSGRQAGPEHHAHLFRRGASGGPSRDLGCGLTPEQAEALSGLDALLIPVGGFYTIDAGQAKAVVDQLKPRVVVPMHYRGKDFGYEVIGPVEDFLALQSGVVRYEGNVLELTQDTPAQTAVLTYLG